MDGEIIECVRSSLRGEQKYYENALKQLEVNLKLLETERPEFCVEIWNKNVSAFIQCYMAETISEALRRADDDEGIKDIRPNQIKVFVVIKKAGIKKILPRKFWAHYLWALKEE